jgi:anti-anti-sigma factor
LILERFFFKILAPPGEGEILSRMSPVACVEGALMMVRENLLSVEYQVVRETGRMNLDGELIAETRFEPERIMREWLDDGVSRVIVCCQRLSHIDSAGLSTLLGALHRFRRSGGDLILADMNPSLNAIFEVTSMERYFKIFQSLAEAEAHFEQLSAQQDKLQGGVAAKKNR